MIPDDHILKREWISHQQPQLARLDWLLTHTRDPQHMPVAIELHDNLLLDRLLRLGVKVYGINPKSAERARDTAHTAEVRHRVQTIRTLNARLAEIDQALQELVAEHPGAAISRSLPNCGPVSTAAMPAGFGEHRQRWNGHEELAARGGVAPVTIQSGKHRTVRRRRACDATGHQAWLWFAFNTVRKEGCWAREDYQPKGKAGCDHFTALRCIVDRCVKIAYRCWHERALYDEELHQERRAVRVQPRMTK